MIDWKKADWTKTNRYIAEQLACTVPSVFNKRNQLGLPKINGYVNRHPPTAISEPIDTKKLAAAFEKAGWKWGDYPNSFYPDSSRLMLELAKRKAHLATRKATHEVYNSGGISVEWHEEKIVVLLDAKLAAHYA